MDNIPRRSYLIAALTICLIFWVGVAIVVGEASFPKMFETVWNLKKEL